MGAWLTTTARNSAIDAMRRDQRFELIRPELLKDDVGYDMIEAQTGSEVADDMLRLIFTCAHPALHIEARVALCLGVVCGLRTEEIARAFLVTDATMSQRLWRAKTKIRDAGIAYRSPEPEELESRLKSVLAVIYLIFNEGWLARAGNSGMRMGLVEEAIRLGRLLTALPATVVALNHAVAVSESRGALEGLRLLESLSESKAMHRYHLYHAARAEMLSRCDRKTNALESLAQALDCCPKGVEREFLLNRQVQIQTG